MYLNCFLLFCFLNVAACESGKWLTRIGSSPRSKFQNLEEYHHAILLGNRIWLFSRKYFPQPNHNWGHHITFQGGYSIFFDLEAKDWSEKVDYSSLIIDEDLDEFLFVLGSDIYLLLYTTFKEVTFQHLYSWDAHQRNWTEQNSFQVDPLCNNVDAGWRAEIVEVDQAQPSNRLYFILSPHNSRLLYGLTIDENGTVKLSLTQNITDERASIWDGKPVKAARINNKFFWLNGMETCGFHIQPNPVMELNVETKEIYDHEFVEEEELPPFSFIGASSTRLLPSGHWIHATGHKQVGEYDSKYCPQIWSLTIGESIAWRKLDVEVPKETNSRQIILVSEDGLLYKIDSKTGIFSGKLPLD